MSAAVASGIGPVQGRGYGVRWEHVRHDYGGGDVLQDVTLEVAAGESVALMGPNGAGKTTLVRMTMGLVRPKAGRVTVGEWDVAGRLPEQMAARVGYAFQHADLQLFARTVRDDVAFGPRRLDLGTDHVDSVLEELDLAVVADRHPYDLPPPLRKMVSLAGVLALRPGVLVLDEPTTGFDRALRELLVAAVRRRLEQGVTVVAVSHDRALVHAVARREVVLERGVVVADRVAG